VCTVLLRFEPGHPWPLLLAAVRDEFADRAWDPPATHWPEETAAGLVGGRDRVAGGTWLAVDPAAPAVAALLNGVRLPPPASGVRPSRGALPLAALTGRWRPEEADLSGYNGFHLLHATATAVRVWTWDGGDLADRSLEPGDHILVNAGIDVPGSPLVKHFGPLLAGTPSPDPRPGTPTAAGWGGWVTLLDGDGLDPADPRALIVRHLFSGRVYASGSATLVGLGAAGLRYDFTAQPGSAAGWYPVPTR
jgi:Transport and Golgi organisation 2